MSCCICPIKMNARDPKEKVVNIRCRGVSLSTIALRYTPRQASTYNSRRYPTRLHEVTNPDDKDGNDHDDDKNNNNGKEA